MTRRPVLSLLLLAGLAACRSVDTPLDAAGKDGPDLTREEARAKLEELCQNLVVTANATGRKVFLATDDVEVKRRSILLKLNLLGMCELILQDENPRRGILDLWTLAYQVRQYGESDEGKQAFGPEAELVAQGAAESAAQVGQAVRALVPDDQYDATERAIEAFARAHPVTAAGARTAQRTSLGDDANLLSVLQLPSLGVAESVDKGAAAVNRAVSILRYVPTQLRWELELTLLDLDGNASVRAALAGMDTVATSVAGIEKTAAGLPAEVQQRLEATFDALDAKQAGLRETLGLARKTLEEADRTVLDARATTEHVQETMTQAREALADANDTLAAVGRATESLAAAGKAWEPTIRQLDLLINPPPDPNAPPPDPDAPPAPNVNDYAAAAEKLTQTAVELRGLIADVKGLAGSDVVTERLGQVDAAGESAVDHAAWRGVQLLVLFFVLLFAYRLATSRLGRR